MKIGNNDFEKYQYTNMFASVCGKVNKKLIATTIIIDSKPSTYFEVFHKNIDIFRSDSLEECIEVFNTL